MIQQVAFSALCNKTLFFFLGMEKNNYKATKQSVLLMPLQISLSVYIIFLHQLPQNGQIERTLLNHKSYLYPWESIDTEMLRKKETSKFDLVVNFSENIFQKILLHWIEETTVVNQNRLAVRSWEHLLWFLARGTYIGCSCCQQIWNSYIKICEFWNWKFITWEGSGYKVVFAHPGENLCW